MLRIRWWTKFPSPYAHLYFYFLSLQNISCSDKCYEEKWHSVGGIKTDVSSILGRVFREVLWEREIRAEVWMKKGSCHSNIWMKNIIGKGCCKGKRLWGQCYLMCSKNSNKNTVFRTEWGKGSVLVYEIEEVQIHYAGHKYKIQLPMEGMPLENFE